MSRRDDVAAHTPSRPPLEADDTPIGRDWVEWAKHLERALREIGLPEHVPQGFDACEWWQFKACKRGEIARDALGVTAEDLIREQWEEAMPRV